MQDLKNNKGVTVTGLVVYMMLLTIVSFIIVAISTNFYSNVKEISESPAYMSEFNKFIMFFVVDVKSNSNISSINSSSVTFEDGTKYSLSNGNMYRNNQLIAKNLSEFSFLSEYLIKDGFTKTIINVKAKITNEYDTIYKDIDFILKYW